MDKIFILDASGYLYASYFAIRNMTNTKGESTNALFGFIRSVLKLLKDFNPSHLVSVFDAPKGTQKRVGLYPEYKAHRKEPPGDLFCQIERAKEFCSLIGIPWLSVSEVEADDTMGSIAVWAKNQGSLVYLCSSDKDLCQLVDGQVSMLNTYKNNLHIGPKEVAEIYGIPPSLMVDYLALVGDASDNVPGIAGFGPKTAAKLLLQFGSLDNLLANPAAIAEQKKKEAVLLHADLARLSRLLVTIDTSVAFPHDPDFFELKTPSYLKLKQFYNSMNFNALLKALEEENAAIFSESGKSSDNQVVADAEKEVCLLVDDEESFAELLARLGLAKEICLQAEVNDQHFMKAELVGIGFGIEGRIWYVPANGKLPLKDILDGIKPLMENPSIAFYSHNAKRLLHIMENYHIKIANINFDTSIASYLLNSQGRRHTLDALLLLHFEEVKTTIDDLLGKGKKALTLQELPIEKVAAFCFQNICDIMKLKKVLESQIARREMDKLFYELELPLTRVLAKMERQGIFLDAPHLKIVSVDVNCQLDILRREIFLLAGEEFNLNSPKQLVVIFLKLGIKLSKKTPKGQLKIDSDVLEELKDSHEIVNKILEYRGLEKLRSTYMEALPQEINPKTERIHCNFNQVVAATGRLSCQDPNLQNIPIRSDIGRLIRESFRPQKPNWSYLSADYSQIELRLLAHFSEDPNLLFAFQNNEDVHSHTASVIFNIPLKDVTKELRQQAKAVNFGIIYGQQAFGLSQELGIDVKAASAFIDTYFERYQKVREFIEFCKEQTRKTGKTVTLMGREREIPEILSKNNNFRVASERLAVNSPLQGTAADIIKMAMLKIDRFLEEHHCQGSMILQIHDELIFELPDRELIEMESAVRSAMESVVKLKVPLIVDISVGKNWKEC